MYSFTLVVVLFAAVQIGAAQLVGSPDPNSYRCPDGYQFSSDYCYKVVTVAKDYAAARAHCESTGDTLASPRTQGDIDAIIDAVGQTANAPGILWLGYTDEAPGSLFADAGGNALAHATWADGEPNNCCGGEHCLQLYADSGLMNDLACSTEIGFVCSAPPQDLDSRCPARWYEHAGDCYRFFGRRRSFHYAEAHCQHYHNAHGRPAHLASVSNQTENDFIADLIAYSWHGRHGLRRAWIGFNDIDQEGMFEWTDHLAVEYTNWRSGDPNNNNNEDCTEINYHESGVWNDVGCHTKRPSVCKMPLFNPLRICRKLAKIINHLIGQCSEAIPPYHP